MKKRQEEKGRGQIDGLERERTKIIGRRKRKASIQVDENR